MNEDIHGRFGRYLVLCGSLRAGTTLLRLLLGQHSQVHGHGESDYLFDGAPALANDNEALTRFGNAVARSRLAAEQGIRRPEGGSYPEMLGEMLRHLAGRGGEGQRLLLTLHRHFDTAAEMLPNAFFIHLQRDPRDVALSAAQMGWGGVPYRAVHCWIEAERSWLAAEDHITQERRCLLRYEDLVSDPRAELSRVLRVAELPFEETVLAPGGGSTYTAPSPRPPEGFRRKMSPREIAELNSRLDFVTHDYGYDLEPKTYPNALRSAVIGAQGRIKHMGFRVQRFGLPVALAEIAGRRLGIAPLSAWARPRVEKQVVRHLK